ncbi:MAG: hypothetical protein R2812_11695 [Gelidibacter sp.]
MLFKTKSYLILTFFALLTFSSCQNEIADNPNPDSQETIVPNSVLANLMVNTCANDGTLDDILDNANCISVNLPVTITVNNITITINTLDDLQLIQNIFDEYDNDDDILEFLFPITITLNDYTEIVINNQDDLETFIEACTETSDVIECVDFQYPISFSIYNSDFQIIDTVTIENDAALYAFLDNLDDDNQGAVLASLNFPVTLVYANGDTLEVNNNQDLQDAINAAGDDCNEQSDDCDMEDVRDYLVDCPQIPTLNGFTPTLTTFTFHESNELTSLYEGDILLSGTWDIAMIDGQIHVFVTFSGFEDFNGEYLVVECGDDELVLQQGDKTLSLSKQCADENSFECFTDFDATIVECDSNYSENNDNTAVFNLTQAYANCIQPSLHTVSYFETMADAETNINAIANPEAFVNTIDPQTVYVRVELNTTGQFEVFEIGLAVENCNTDCTEQQIDTFLNNCIWNVVNYNGSDDLINYNLNFNNDGTVAITGEEISITANWSTSLTGNGVVLEFLNVSGPNIQAITGSWLVIECNEGRLKLQNNNDLMVIERTCD